MFPHSILPSRLVLVTPRCSGYTSTELYTFAEAQEATFTDTKSPQSVDLNTVKKYFMKWNLRQNPLHTNICEM